MTRRLLLFGGICVLLAGCSSQATVPEQDAESSVQLVKPRRIVSLTLGTDEILCALVDPARIVALSRHAAEPEVSNVAEIARKVGVTVDRDAEQIVALHPDLVLAARYSRIELRDLVDRTGAAIVVTTAFQSFDDIEANIASIGRAVGEPQGAAELIARMRQKLVSAEARVREWKPSEKLLYFTSTGWTAGRDTTVHEVFARAGFRNVAAEAGITGHQKVSPEFILKSAPDAVVIGTGYARDLGFRQRLLADPQLAPVEAIRRQKIIELPSRQLLTVSHHLAEAVAALSSAVEALDRSPH